MNCVKKDYAEAVGVFFRPGTLLSVCSIRYLIGSAIYLQIFNNLSVYSSRCVLNIAWSLCFWNAQFTEFLSIKDMEHDNTTCVVCDERGLFCLKSPNKGKYLLESRTEVQVLLRVLKGREVSKSCEGKK